MRCALGIAGRPVRSVTGRKESAWPIPRRIDDADIRTQTATAVRTAEYQKRFIGASATERDVALAVERNPARDVVGAGSEKDDLTGRT